MGAENASLVFICQPKINTGQYQQSEQGANNHAGDQNNADASSCLIGKRYNQYAVLGEESSKGDEANLGVDVDAGLA
ncbi:hypothetical protein HNQ57_000630 [Zhongshania antarctica]|jgi:hypothetical protein|uniref:Uncharacterized protein n=1 Tax=Zhongshania antarctica TaxID=641702 RepID=A0A840QZY1_9GAMM|nr:hypothetical protein [Zhongshania antarctica]MBB5186369.1 hypothetical protein [Zhongshania antarctica]